MVKRLGIDNPPVPEIGTLLRQDANAEAFPLYGAGHIITVNTPVFVLSLLIAKVAVYSAYVLDDKTASPASGPPPTLQQSAQVLRGFGFGLSETMGARLPRFSRVRLKAPPDTPCRTTSMQSSTS